jgi:type II secretory pathway predicted ATPase ExeA
MYEHVFHFFDLRENPFHVSPDPRFFFSTKAHGSALTQLKMGVETRQGFVVLIGEAGTGKTILLHRFLHWLQSREQSSSYIFQSQLKPLELFESILHDFGVRYESRRKGDLLAALKQWLVRRHAMGDSPVLIIDEAQAMSLRTLDRLRMLLNLETPGNKLLQIVLAGQPELEEKLHRPELRQLHQRIMFRCTLLPLSLEETSEYIKSRLANGGAKTTELFPDETLEAVHIYGQGIPRVVNLLCEHALLEAFAEKSRLITPEVISRVATTFDLTPVVPAPRPQIMVPRIEQRIPKVTAEKRKEVTAPVAAFAEKKREKEDASPSVWSAQEVKKAAGLPNCEPIFLKKESISLAAAAGATSASGKARKPVAIQLSTQEAKPQVLPNCEPAFLKKESIPLAAAAGAMSASGGTPEALAAPSPRISSPAPKVPEQEAPTPAASKELPIKSNRPSLGNRFMRYCRGVEQSFVRDCKQFLRTSVQAETADRSSDTRRSHLRRKMLIPIAKWMMRPMGSPSRRRASGD